MEKDLT